MATIGQVLATPEAGWKRYEGTEGNFWTDAAVGSDAAYSGSNYLGMTPNKKLKFDFTGTKIRIIAATNGVYSERVSIKINGVEETFSTAISALKKVLVYEKVLTEGRHTVDITNLSTSNFIFDAIDIDSTGRSLHRDEVTAPNDLSVGKRIRAHYTTSVANTVGSFSELGKETSNFISPASSNLPNGDFYFIMVDEGNGKKKLIADRNVQHSISWDALNSAGIASGSGLPDEVLGLNNVVPSLTSNVSATGYTASASTENATNAAWGAFDSGTNLWVTSVGSRTGWLRIDLPSAKEITRYTMESYTSSVADAPADWILEGYTGVVWEVIDTRSGLTRADWGSGTKKSFKILNTKPYNSYRLTINAATVGGTGNQVNVKQLELFEEIQQLKSSSFTTRLLTGGTVAADKDNEWDQYLVGSTLNGSIVAGDTSTWLIGTDIGSWTSTSGASAYRTIRARTNNISSFQQTYTTNTVVNVVGFRPVLEIESLIPPPPPPLLKHFIYEAGQYKKYLEVIEGDMVKDISYVEAGTLLRLPLNKLAQKITIKQ